MRSRVRQLVGATAVAMTLGLGVAACSESRDDSGAVTELDEVGPQLAKLRAEVDALRQEVRALREQLATTGTTTTTIAPLR
jgi:outer membrane murein-binding lipoprotein Lpp